jgi:predicted flap endonuclease-1-like 5' DNA nuclease
MTIHAIVKRKSKKRVGKGFSKEELKEVGLSCAEALNLDIPIDTRRSTKHDENMQTLKTRINELKPKSLTVEKKERIFELIKVKGLGSKTAEKLKGAGIETANELAVSNPETIMKVSGISEKRASSLIKAARFLLKSD